MKQLLKLYLPLLFAATIGIACSGDDDDGDECVMSGDDDGPDDSAEAPDGSGDVETPDGSDDAAETPGAADDVDHAQEGAAVQRR